MKKSKITPIVLTLITIISTSLLTSCNMPDYKQEDKERIEENAIELTKDWFSNRYGEDIKLNSYKLQNETTNESVSNYSITSAVYGQYKEKEVINNNGEENIEKYNQDTYDYLFDIESKKLYTNHNSEEITNKIVDEIIKDLGVKDTSIIDATYQNQSFHVTGYISGNTLKKKDAIVMIENGLLLEDGITEEQQYDFLKEELQGNKTENNNDDATIQEKKEQNNDTNTKFTLTIKLKAQDINTKEISKAYQKWKNVNIIIELPYGELRLYTNNNKEFE